MNKDSPKCRKCGSRNSERFFHKYVDGVRCLDCGHELVTEERFKSGASIINAYVGEGTDATF